MKAFLPLLLLCTACGSSDNTASPSGDETTLPVDAFEACGGDVLGKWTLNDWSMVGSLHARPSGPCANIPAFASFIASGEAEYSENGTWTSATTDDGQLTTYLYSAACVVDLTGGSNCQDLKLNAGVTCRHRKDTGCNCDWQLAGTGQQPASGPYLTEGSQITYKAGTDEAYAGEYCASAAKLVVRLSNDSLSYTYTYERKVIR